MNKRTLIRDLPGKHGESVTLGGWVDKVKDQKRMQFLVLRDHTGYLQVVNEKGSTPYDNVVSSLSNESVVYVGGKVIPNPSVRTGNGLELRLESIDVANTPSGSLPIDASSNIDARLDWRYLDLRDPKKLLIFKIQTTAEHAMREWWMNNGFMEIHSPKLLGAASESGAELFKLDYFGKTACLAQSPQFYKQMAMSAGFDRVFEIGPVFRANSSHTNRHDTEFTSVDMEVSFVNSHEDVMEIEENWLNYVLSRVKTAHGEEIKRSYGQELEIPSVPFPRVTMDEAYRILDSQGYVVPREQKGDLDPEGERRLAKHIKETFNHDFVFVTDYPAKSRAFYHMRHEDRPDITKSFDLIWKGTEVTTGAQREHRYDRLVNQATEKGIDPQSVSSYTDFFKYGVPPHGGLGFGLTRMLMNITGLENVKEVTFVYRGPNRLTP
ncbi:aspartate--tRNA(Asn) ligase [Candidatus Pacearchaeota archaeon]|nr:aspartate--tRNA(Asn) ligase [Candidatus Pacearchaeota archaeon]